MTVSTTSMLHHRILESKNAEGYMSKGVITINDSANAQKRQVKSRGPSKTNAKGKNSPKKLTQTVIHPHLNLSTVKLMTRAGTIESNIKVDEPNNEPEQSPVQSENKPNNNNSKKKRSKPKKQSNSTPKQQNGSIGDSDKDDSNLKDLLNKLSSKNNAATPTKQKPSKKTVTQVKSTPKHELDTSFSMPSSPETTSKYAWSRFQSSPDPKELPIPTFISKSFNESDSVMSMQREEGMQMIEDQPRDNSYMGVDNHARIVDTKSERLQMLMNTLGKFSKPGCNSDSVSKVSTLKEVLGVVRSN